MAKFRKYLKFWSLLLGFHVPSFDLFLFTFYPVFREISKNIAIFKITIYRFINTTTSLRIHRCTVLYSGTLFCRFNEEIERFPNPDHYRSHGFVEDHLFRCARNFPFGFVFTYNFRVILYFEIPSKIEEGYRRRRFFEKSETVDQVGWTDQNLRVPRIILIFVLVFYTRTNIM